MAHAVTGAGAREADAAAIAHDLANVIAVLAGSSAMLVGDLAGLPTDHPAREQASRLALATERAAALCEGLGATLRPVAAPARSRGPATFDLLGATREACELIGPSLPLGCTLASRDDAPRVPGAAMDAFQVVLNLALNAAEASGGTVRLHVDAAVAGREPPLLGRLVPGRRYGRLIVEDDGPGMPARAGHLFERGVTGSGDPRRGTGLSTVAAIVEGAGGALVVGRSGSGGARIEAWWPEAAGSDLAGASILVVAGTSGPTARTADALEAAGAEPSLCFDPMDAIASLSEDMGAWDAVVVAGPTRGESVRWIAGRLAALGSGVPILALCEGAAPGATTLPATATGGEIVRCLAGVLSPAPGTGGDRCAS